MYYPTIQEDRAKETAYAEFYLHARPYNDESGVVKHKDIEMVRITPLGGNANLIVEREVDETIKERFAKQYQAFKEGREAEVEGTDLKNWPVITPAELKNCLSLRIFSVEQLAEANESVIKALGLGSRAIVNKARAYVAASNSEATRIMAENVALKEENDKIRTRLNLLEDENKTMAAQIELIMKRGEQNAS